MLNLSSLKLFRKTTDVEKAAKEKADSAEEKKEKNKRIVAVVVSKDANLELVTKSLKEEGLLVGDAALTPTKTEDGQVIFKSEDFTEEDSVVVRQSANLALVCKGFDSYKAATASFNDRLGIQNYYNGVDTATRALTYAINSAISEAGSPEEAMTLIDNITGEFNDYIAGLVEGLPAQCFTPNVQRVAKAADMVADTVEIEKAAKCPKCGESMVHKCAPESAKKEAPEPVAAPPAEVPPAAAAAPAETPAAPAPAAPAEVAKAEPEDGIAKAISDLARTLAEVKKSQEVSSAQTTEAISKMGESIAAISKRTDDLTAKTAEAIQKADTAATKISGAIPSLSVAADLPAKAQEVRKSDTFGPGASFDTAFMPRRGK